MNQNVNIRKKYHRKLLKRHSRTTATPTTAISESCETEEFVGSDIPTTTTTLRIPVLQHLRKKVFSKRPDVSIELFDPVKTQVAKVSYKPRKQHLSKSRRSEITSRDNSNFGGTSETAQPSEMETAASNAHDDFAKKKKEREQEIKEIQEMLTKMSKSPQHSPSATATSNEVIKKKRPDEDQETKSEIGKSSSKKNSLRRSNTDLQISAKSCSTTADGKARVSRKDTPKSAHNTGNQSKRRSISSQLPVSATTTHITLASQASKRTAYKSEEARRFMEVQKKKRKPSVAEDAQIKANIEKEEIKKRLEELKKNTRKLVNKNLEKKNKQQFGESKRSNLKSIESSNKLAEPAREISNPISNENPSNRLSSRLRSSFKGSLSERPKPKNNKVDPPKSAQSAQTRAYLPLGENTKRIGLLRNTENEKDYSFSALKGIMSGKENKGLEILASKVDTTLEDKAQQNSSETGQKEKIPCKEGNISDTEIITKNSGKNDSCSEDSNKCKTSIQKPHELPYLLRPSAAQVYPYNFIMAVRRKLEAVTQPATIIPQKQETTCVRKNSNERENLLTLDGSIKRKLLDEQEEQEYKKSKSDESPIIPLTDNAVKNLYETNSQKECALIDHKNEDLKLENLNSPNTYNIETDKRASNGETFIHCKTSQITKAPAIGVVNGMTLKNKTDGVLKYQSMESITSDFSSVSLKVPISNTLTEVSSLRSDSRRTYTHSVEKQNYITTEDETTSMSSLAFSSPEKKYYKQHQNEFHFVKPRPVSPLSLEKVEKLKIKSKRAQDHSAQYGQLVPTDNQNVHFSQLLEDFNRSLSQVIQVNEQLKSTLDKSQRILSPRTLKTKTPTTETDRQYSSDFENSPQPSSKGENINQNLQITKENFKQLKKSLEVVGSNVVSSLIPQNISTDSERIESLNELPLPQLDLGVNLKLISNSSVRTSSSLQTNDYASEQREVNCNDEDAEQSQEEYEKRINIIEQLKENLKKSIEESQQINRGSKQSVSSFEGASHKAKMSNRSIYTMEPENEVEEPDGIQSKIDFNHEIIDHNNKKKFISAHGKDHFNEKFTNSLREENKNETLVLYKRSSEMQEHSKTSSSTSVESYNKEKEKYPNRKHYKVVAPLKQEKNCDPQSISTNNYKQTHNFNDYSAHLNCAETSPKKSGHNRPSSQNTKLMEGEIALIAKHSDVESNHKITFEGNVIAQKPKEDDATSSISEDLQDTYEMASQDNENIPSFTQQSHRIISTYRKNAKTNNSSFINTHINRSRGDFQNTGFSDALVNETQFQLAVKASSLTSSTENAQSADDEVTSSVKSLAKEQRNSNANAHDVINNRTKSHSNATTASPSKSSRRMSIGNEIVNFFHKYDSERSQLNQDTMSESSLNYSNVGLYDKLIQNEMTKSEHLMALLKMREKALLDRTKGQIAWLEVQKARYKAKGLLSNIAVIKKKQRGIILKMEKEREEIKRLLQANGKPPLPSATTTFQSSVVPFNKNNSGTSSNKCRITSPTPEIKPYPVQPSLVPVTQRSFRALRKNQSSANKEQQPHPSAPVLRATYELESSQALEELLQKREEDLRRRRQHVEHLMRWHQRLDDEEAEVLQLERQLLNYNNAPQQSLGNEQQPNPLQQQQMPLLQSVTSKEKLTLVPNKEDKKNLPNQSGPKTPEKKRASRARKMEKRLKDIDRSLKELSHISVSSAANSTVVMGQNSEDIDASSTNITHDVEFVRTTGSKLNKLWRRLTSQTIEKYEPNRRYKLCKADLELLYEEAKMAVLRDFAQDEERTAQELLEKSSTNPSATSSPQQKEFGTCEHGSVEEVDSDGKASVLEIPVLNLNFSSGHSEGEEEAANNAKRITTPQGIYSPSAAEQNFKAQLPNSSASSSSDSSEQASPPCEQNRHQQRIDNNVQMFIALTQRLKIGSNVHNNIQQPRLQRSLSDTQIAEIPKLSATTSQKNAAVANASQISTGITSSEGHNLTTHQTLQIQHQRSKSSIVEITYIPKELEKDVPLPQDSCKSSKELETKDCKLIEKIEKPTDCSRSSVIASVGKVSSTSQTATLPRNHTTRKPTKTCPSYPSQERHTFSAQVGLDSEQRANEISSKLDQITVAVMQLTQANLLPSYSTATTLANSKTAALTESTNNDSNLSTDTSSSYSLHFANISTDRHSSPESQQPNNMLHCTNTSFNNTCTTTFTKEITNTSESIINSNTSSVSPTCTKTFIMDKASKSSKTFIKDQTISCSPSPSPTHESKSSGVSHTPIEKTTSEEYVNDFEPDSSDETHIEDISLPLLETTAETIAEGVDGEGSLNQSTKDDASAKPPTKDDRFCTESTSIEIGKAEVPPITVPSITEISNGTEKEQFPPPLMQSPPPLSALITGNSTSCSTLSPAQMVAQNSSQLMPDILNELELRRHQLLLDNEHLKQYEHVTAVPYMYVREIPNKPPPPYVPPAHGSPMTTIFPSEERIKDITFRRTHELYCELLKTEYCNEQGQRLPSVMEEQITNIYERIILDICREYLEEHSEILRDGDPTNFHSQLSFFNPPNRLRCIQDAIYKEVRSCLAMDKAQPKKTQVYSVYGQRAKQDHIGKIIIQEMYDEDDRWCNFHREESEVLDLIVEEMIRKNILVVAKEVLLEEGGVIEEDEENDGVEIEELECTEVQETLQNDDQIGTALSTTIVITNKIEESDQTVVNNDQPTHSDDVSDANYDVKDINTNQQNFHVSGKSAS